MFLNLLWLEETTSTQEIIRNLPVYSLVVANRQTAGRGRMGRVWHSQEGGLYFSFSLPKGLRQENTLPLVVANSVADHLKSLGFMPAIKWVNDVYLQGKKLCGVLTQGLKDLIIVGAGINLNQENFPEELEAISLKMVCGKTFDKADFLFGLLNFIVRDLHTLQEEGFVPFRSRIENRLLFMDEQVVLFTPEPVAGIMKGIDSDGSLLLLTQEGLKAFRVGEVTLRLI